MKLKFVRAYRPKGDATDIRAYADGEVVTFEGAVGESYARKYIARGLAVEAKDEPKKPAPEASVPTPSARSPAEATPAATKEPFSLKKK